MHVLIRVFSFVGRTATRISIKTYAQLRRVCIPTKSFFAGQGLLVRSVFRALTRLRGAAITSYDGVARSQTGNIDEYNHLHKWRETHPLHHLADEESDVR